MSNEVESLRKIDGLEKEISSLKKIVIEQERQIADYENILSKIRKLGIITIDYFEVWRFFQDNNFRF